MDPNDTTGCPHLLAKTVTETIEWCPTCGSIYLPESGWEAPSAAVLPGWTCACGTFNGAAKELLAECRRCGHPKPGIGDGRGDEVMWDVRLDGSVDPVTQVSAVGWYQARGKAMASLDVSKERLHVSRARPATRAS